MTNRLRVVVFSAGEWTFDRERIVRALSDDERFEIVLIVIDDFRRSIWKRARFLLRVWGPWNLAASALAALACKTADWSKRLLRHWHDSFAPRVESKPTIVETPDIQVVRVPDINAPETIKQVNDAAPDLGIILGGRILKADLIHAPRLGTLNIHKHDVRHYRGGAEVGYPEILNGDKELGITIHWATAVVDAGPVVATSSVPVEKFDTIGG